MAEGEVLEGERVGEEAAEEGVGWDEASDGEFDKGGKARKGDLEVRRPSVETDGKGEEELGVQHSGKNSPHVKCFGFVD